MKRSTKLLGILLSVAMAAGMFTSAPLTAGAQTEKKDLVKSVLEHKKDRSEKLSYTEGEAVVIMKDNKTVGDIEDAVDVEEYIDLVNGDSKATAAVVSDGDSTTEEIIDELKDDPDVKYVLPNSTKKLAGITDDTYSDFQWALSNTGQNGGTPDMDVNPENAWATARGTGEECVVAVIDSGVDLNHEDLASVLWRNTYSELPGKGCYGYDFTGADSDGQPRDNIGHGTHVAGIIAAQANNGIGVSGVNTSGVKIMMLKIINEENDGIDLKDEIKAFEYIIKAKKLGVNIVAVNCSYGGLSTIEEKDFYDDKFNELGRLGIVSCVCAGNESFSIDAPITEYGETLYYTPAMSDSKYCLTVGAANEKGNCAAFSNYGTKCVDIFAPGTNILSAVPENTFLPSVYSAEQRADFCEYFQDFENGINDGDFCGNVSVDTKDSWEYSPNMQISLCGNESFGVGQKCLRLNAFESSVEVYYYLVNIPYTVNSVSYDYSISISAKSLSGECYMGLYDRPYGGDTNESYGAMAGIGILDNSWGVYSYRISPNDMPNYVKSKNRAISLMLVSESPLTDILIDDVAVSKQKIKTSQFGKYDFMTGSSQASPFVAGAAALVHNAHPELNAMDVINTLKSSSKQSESLNNYAEGGRFLDLESVDEHAIAAYVPVSGVSLNTTALTLSVGNKYTLRATVTPSNATDKAVVWSTSDESVAAVSADGVVTAKKTGAAVITAKTGDGLSASCKVTAIIPVSGIKLNYSALTMTAGTKFTLKATVTPSDATNKTVYWSSSSPSVAGMAAGGVINAKKAGTTTVTAKTSNGKAATCKITVKPAPAPTGIKLGTTSLTMTAGTKYTLKATVLPSTANNKTVYWSSSNTSVAGMAAGGVINAKKAGSCTITAKTANGKKATCKLTVKPKSNTVFVTGIKLNASKLTMTAGTKYTLKATITPSNATNKNVTWSSSDPSVAGMAAGGVINAKKAGTCTITAKTNNGKTAICKVTVNPSAETYIANFNKLRAYINRNGTSDMYGGKYIERSAADKSVVTYITAEDDGSLTLEHSEFKSSQYYTDTVVTWNLNKSDKAQVETAYYDIETYDSIEAIGTVNVKTYNGSNASFGSNNALGMRLLNSALNRLDTISREVAGVSVQNLGFTKFPQN